MQPSISDTSNPSHIANPGGGSRGRTHSRIAASLGGCSEITAAADPAEVRKAVVAGHRLAFLAEESLIHGGIPKSSAGFSPR